MADDNINLLQALQGGLYRPAESMAGIGAQTIAQSIPNLTNPYASDTSNMGTTLGAGLLAGLLAGYARQDAASQNAQLMPLMGQIMQAQPTERMALAAGNPRLSPLVQALAFDDYARKNKREDAVLTDVQKFQALNPLELQRRMDENFIDTSSDQGLVPTGRVENGRPVYKTYDELGLKSPQDLKVDETLATEEAKLQAETNAYGFNPKREGELDKLRKEFSALPEVKNYSQVEKAASIINQAIQDPKAMSDLELTRYAILLIEPGMAVREGEQAAVSASQSIPDAYKGRISKALNGEAELGEEARQALLNLATRSYEGHKMQYDRALGFYRKEAESKLLDPDRISYMGEAREVDDVYKNSGSTILAPDGQQYVFTD
jgi:hypothetical protein